MRSDQIRWYVYEPGGGVWWWGVCVFMFVHVFLKFYK